MADDIMNTFCAVAGITTVRHDAFIEYAKPDRSLRGSILDVARSTLWVERNFKHRFTLDQLPEVFRSYVEHNSLSLDDSSAMSILEQIYKHAAPALKNYQHRTLITPPPSQERHLRQSVLQSPAPQTDSATVPSPSTVSQEFSPAPESRPTQACTATPKVPQPPDSETEQPCPWPALQSGPQSQRASTFSNLRAALQARDERYRKALQADVDAVTTRKRKALEDGNPEPEPEFGRKERITETKPRKKKVFASQHRCHECGKEFPTNSRLQRHVLTHQEPTYPCRDPHCDQMFKDKTGADNHYNRIHAKTTQLLCPKCERPQSTKFNMERHMAMMHPDTDD